MEVNNQLGGLSTDPNTDQKSSENEEVDWSITAACELIVMFISIETRLC